MKRGKIFKNINFIHEKRRKRLESNFILELSIFRINKIFLDMREHFSFRVINDKIGEDQDLKDEYDYTIVGLYNLRSYERRTLEKFINKINIILKSINSRLTRKYNNYESEDYIVAYSHNEIFKNDLKVLIKRLLQLSYGYKKFFEQIVEQLYNLKRLEIDKFDTGIPYLIETLIKIFESELK